MRISFFSLRDLVWIVWAAYFFPQGLCWPAPLGYLVEGEAGFVKPSLLYGELPACNSELLLLCYRGLTACDSGDNMKMIFLWEDGIFVGGCYVAWESGHWGRVVGWVDLA